MKKSEMTFENAMAELENITDKLSDGNLALDEMMKLYDEGLKLSAYCKKILDSYDKKLEKAEVKSNDEGQD